MQAEEVCLDHLTLLPSGEAIPAGCYDLIAQVIPQTYSGVDTPVFKARVQIVDVTTGNIVVEVDTNRFAVLNERELRSLQSLVSTPFEGDEIVDSNFTFLSDEIVIEFNLHDTERHKDSEPRDETFSLDIDFVVQSTSVMEPDTFDMADLLQRAKGDIASLGRTTVVAAPAQSMCEFSCTQETCRICGGVLNNEGVCPLPPAVYNLCWYDTYNACYRSRCSIGEFGLKTFLFIRSLLTGDIFMFYQAPIFP